MRLGRVLGIPIRASYSWVILLVLATYFMTFVQLPFLFPDAPLLPRLIVGSLFTLLFFGSIFFHELAHAVVALSNDLRVQSITLLIFGGFTAVEMETTRPRTEAWIAIAGPVASLLLGLTFLVMAFSVGYGASMAATLIWWLGWTNLVIAGLNMLPGLPLDGGRVFQAIAWRATGSRFRGSLAAINAGRFLGLAEIVLGVVFFFLNEVIVGVWLVLFGWFLRTAAGGARQEAVRREMLKDLVVREVLERRWPRVASGTSLASLVEDEDFLQGRRSYLVYEGDTWVGMIPVRVVRAVAPTDRRNFRVSDVMVHREQILQVKPDDLLLPLLQTMEEQRIGYVPVLGEEGEVIGVLSRDRVLALVEERSALQRKTQAGG